MLAFIGFITVIALVFGVSFGEALGGFFGFCFKAIIVCGVICFIGWLFSELTSKKH